jgi:predicted Zn-ribbon and HTH transcriptional regulator
MPYCDECGFYVPKERLVKEWKLKNVIVRLWQCQHCGFKFRRYVASC